MAFDKSRTFISNYVGELTQSILKLLIKLVDFSELGDETFLNKTILNSNNPSVKLLRSQYLK